MQQALALRASFPQHHPALSSTCLDWQGTLTPTPLSRSYRVRVTYSIGRYPEVWVLQPTIAGRPGESIPHLFSNGSLCLHLEDEWSSAMFIAYTTIPWTAEWLLNYEIWLATGTWYGGGEWPPPRQSNSTPTANMTRSERRRKRRRRPR